MFFVLQAFVVIAKLSGRKTKSFLNFFLKTAAGIYPFFKSYLSEVRTLYTGKEAGVSKCLVYFLSQIC